MCDVACALNAVDVVRATLHVRMSSPVHVKSSRRINKAKFCIKPAEALSLQMRDDLALSLCLCLFHQREYEVITVLI